MRFTWDVEDRELGVRADDRASEYEMPLLAVGGASSDRAPVDRQIDMESAYLRLRSDITFDIDCDCDCADLQGCDKGVAKGADSQR